MKKNINYEKLSLLGDKVKSETASKSERDEFMLMLYQNGNLTKEQYLDYKSNNDTNNEILNAGLAVGAILLLGFFINEIFKSK